MRSPALTAGNPSQTCGIGSGSTYCHARWSRPSKHAGSNPEAFWLWPIMAVTASVAKTGPGRLCQIRLSASISAPFSQRRHGSYCAKPTRIQYGRPGQGLAKHIWSGSKLVCKNHLARFLAGRNRPASSFPLSDSVPYFRRRPG